MRHQPNKLNLPYFFALLALFAFALALRAYRIGDVPDIVHIDEAGLGYNAWCLANYGIDRYGNAMPVYPQNFYGGQSPLYTYLAALLAGTSGGGPLSLPLLRLPGILFSMLVVIFGTGIISLVYGSRKITLLGAALLSVCPYFIMHGRYALDCNLMLGASTVALCLLTRYAKSGKMSHLAAYSAAFGIVLYSYALSYFVVPIFLCLITLYLLWCRKITLRCALLSAACVCVTALPILLFVCTLLFRLPPMQFLGLTISPTAASRLEDVSFSLRSFRNNVIDVVKYTLTSDGRPLDAPDRFYTMYVISIPFIGIGLAASCVQWLRKLRSRTFDFGFIFIAFYAAGLAAIGFSRGYIYRANFLFISYLYFLVCGIVCIYRLLRSWGRHFILLLGFGYLCCTAAFVQYYFTDYSPAETIPQFVPANDAIRYVQAQPDIRDLYIDYSGVSEFYSLFFPESPHAIEETAHEDGYGRYHFAIPEDTPVKPDNAYIVLKNNQPFLANIRSSGHTWQIVEYPYHYLFYQGQAK